MFTKAILQDHGGEEGHDVGIAIDRSETNDIGTPSTAPLKDDAPVTRPEGELPTPTDHNTTFTGLSPTERYECMSKDVLTRASRPSFAQC